MASLVGAAGEARDPMGVYTRPDSPYFWIWLEGTRIRFSTNLRHVGVAPAQRNANKVLAQQIYHSAMHDLARDRFDLPSITPARTFDEQAAWYETHHTAKHRGALQEARKLARLRAFFGRFPLEQITPQLWTEYETERTTVDGVALSTVGRELAIMKCVLNSAIGEHLEYHRLGQVRRKSTAVLPKHTITRHEEPGFHAALEAIDPELADLYLVGVGTLLRQENLIYLQRHEYRGDAVVVLTKTGPHQVPLTGPTELQRRAAAILARRLPTTPQGYFFPRWKGTFAAYDDPGHPGVLLRKKVQRAARAIGLPWGLAQGGIVWHTATRASGATRLIREYQIDVRTVQLLGGWRSLDQMAAYLGLTLDLAGQRSAVR
jgi:integrase